MKRRSLSSRLAAKASQSCFLPSSVTTSPDLTRSAGLATRPFTVTRPSQTALSASRRDSFGKHRTTRKPGPVYLLGGAMARAACMRTRMSSIAAAACTAAAVLHLLQRGRAECRCARNARYTPEMHRCERCTRARAEHC